MQSSILQNTNEQNENLETVETDDTNNVLCLKHCIICNSGMAPIVNDYRAQGKTLREIATYCTDKGLQLTKDVVQRHFNRYNNILRQQSSIIAYEHFKRDSETLAEHQNQVLYLMHYVFREIVNRIEVGTLKPEIADFERLTKLHYQVLADPSHGVNPDINVFIDKAFSDHRMLSINQVTLPFQKSSV